MAAIMWHFPRYREKKMMDARYTTPLRKNSNCLFTKSRELQVHGQVANGTLDSAEERKHDTSPFLPNLSLEAQRFQEMNLAKAL